MTVPTDYFIIEKTFFIKREVMRMSYVPRILLCGEESSFREAAAGMAVEVVGKISFTGSPERGENFLFPNPKDVLAFVPKDLKIFLDGAEISADELRKILDGSIDYVVFDNRGEFVGRHNDLCALKIFEQCIPRETLFRQARRNFYSAKNFVILSKILREKNFSRVLDVDGNFFDTDFFMFAEMFPRVEGVIKNPAPILENFYAKIYGSLDECRFKIFDAILLIERSPEKIPHSKNFSPSTKIFLKKFLRSPPSTEIGFSSKSARKKIFAFTSSLTKTRNFPRCPKATKSFTPAMCSPKKISAACATTQAKTSARSIFT